MKKNQWMKIIFSLAPLIALYSSDVLACSTVKATNPGDPPLPAQSYDGTSEGSGGYNTAIGNGVMCNGTGIPGNGCMIWCGTGQCTSAGEQAQCNTAAAPPPQTPNYYSCVPVRTPPPGNCKSKTPIDMCGVNTPTRCWMGVSTYSSGIPGTSSYNGNTDCACPNSGYYYPNPVGGLQCPQ